MLKILSFIDSDNRRRAIYCRTPYDYRDTHNVHLRTFNQFHSYDRAVEYASTWHPDTVEVYLSELDVLQSLAVITRGRSAAANDLRELVRARLAVLNAQARIAELQEHLDILNTV